MDILIHSHFKKDDTNEELGEMIKIEKGKNQMGKRNGLMEKSIDIILYIKSN